MEAATETGVNMSGPKTIFAAILLIGVTVRIMAQSRQEPQQTQPVPTVAPGTAGNEEPDNSNRTPPSRNPAPGVDSAYSRDAFSTTMTGARVVLGPGDQLEVSVFDTPELTQRVRVNSEGKISLALIGEIDVRGMAPDKLEQLITRKLVDGNFMKDPQVSVFVMEYAGQMTYVTGEVTRPGAYPLLRSHRLQDLISVAGGLNSRASNTVTIVRGNDAAHPLQVDLSNKDAIQANPEVLPGDSITVNQAGIVYVLGDVNRPGGFMLDRRTTLSVVQAVALAEGTKTSAALTKAILVRTTEGKRQETPLNLKMIMKSQNPDLLLQTGDIVYVPGSLMRGMGKTSIEVLESSAGLAAVYSTRP
jgi:polysaccharide export outer membrane protein